MPRVTCLAPGILPSRSHLARVAQVDEDGVFVVEKPAASSGETTSISCVRLVKQFAISFFHRIVPPSRAYSLAILISSIMASVCHAVSVPAIVCHAVIWKGKAPPARSCETVLQQACRNLWKLNEIGMNRYSRVLHPPCGGRDRLAARSGNRLQPERVIHEIPRKQSHSVAACGRGNTGLRRAAGERARAFRDAFRRRRQHQPQGEFPPAAETQPRPDRRRWRPKDQRPVILHLQGRQARACRLRDIVATPQPATPQDAAFVPSATGNAFREALPGWATMSSTRNPTSPRR